MRAEEGIEDWATSGLQSGPTSTLYGLEVGPRKISLKLKWVTVSFISSKKFMVHYGVRDQVHWKLS